MKPRRPKYIIVVYQRKGWRWKTLNANGKIINSSEQYSSKYKATQTAYNNFLSYKEGHATFKG